MQRKEIKLEKIKFHTMSYLRKWVKNFPHSFLSREQFGAGATENWGNAERLVNFLFETIESMFNSCDLQKNRLVNIFITNKSH
jgi:hypothetical protein